MCPILIQSPGRTYELRGRHRLETNLAPFAGHSRGDAADARPMPGICASTRLLNGETHTRSQERDDDAIATLAFHQEGIIARKQLLEIRIGRRAISNRIRNGRLRHQHPGVYAVGHEALTFKAKTVAAALSVAPEVATTHWTSGAHWEVCKPGEWPDPHDLSPGPPAPSGNSDPSCTAAVSGRHSPERNSDGDD